MKSILCVLFGLLASWAEVVLGARITPLEQIWRGLLRSPLNIDITSRSTQFAGRTTLNSGSATVTISTSNVKSNSLIYMLVEAALPAAYTTKGLAAIAAGAATATASTTAVFSGQYIGLTFDAVANQASGQGRGFRVNSIVDGVSFAITTVDGQNVTSGPPNIAWNIAHAELKDIKVNTITDGGYFTVGWSDGQSRPRDATLHWEVRNPA